MAESAVRIGLPADYREQEGTLPRPKAKEKHKPTPTTNAELSDLDMGESEEQGNHELDTIA